MRSSNPPARNQTETPSTSGTTTAPAQTNKVSHGIIRNQSKWNTREFYIYIAVVGSAAVYVAWRGFLLSRSFTPGGGRAHLRLPGLRQGWIHPDLKVDVSDSQWREFRDNVHLLSAVALGHCTVSKLASLVLPEWADRGVRLLLGVVFVLYLHGAASAFLLTFSFISFLTSHAAAGVPGFGPLVIWFVNLGLLLLSRLNNGFTFTALSAALAPLDKHRGVFRWHICYNLVVLRMISFGMDLHWRRMGRGFTRSPAATAASERLAYKTRTLIIQPEDRFSGSYFYLYILYPPLYMAGPTITFNAFVSQVHLPQTSYPPRALALYLLRLLASALAIEVLQHCIHAPALASSGLWRPARLGATDLGVASFWVLNFMWLKFLVIWRFFRSWSLLDGIETPENICKCVNNNYDIEGFWKNWHSSFNRWLVRYMYIPLGGSRYRAANIWPIFTFVAIWHDLHPRLLLWAWLTCAFAGPEMAAKWIARCPAVRPYRDTWQYRHICAAGAAVNILVLMAANLVGFVVGVEGVHHFVVLMVSSSGAVFLPATIVTFFSASQLMFEIQEGKLRDQAKALTQGHTNVKYPEPEENCVKCT